MKNNIIRRIGVLTLIISMFLTMVPGVYFAENGQENVDDVVGAIIPDIKIEIPEDAIYLATAEEFLAFVENCRVNTWSVGKTFVLSKDIDLSGEEFDGIPTFGGIFVGQGYTIKGLQLIGKGSVVGFFRYLQKTAIVDGLKLEGSVTPDGTKSVVGGFAGKNAGVIQNCTFSGTVSGYEQVGGFVGYNESTGVINRCATNGEVYGSHFIGGIAGDNAGQILACTNEAEINTKSVQNSVNLEDITLDNIINTERVDIATDIGGIAGISSGVIRQCTNQGVVGYKNMGYNVGGIAGSQNGYLTDCVNNANIWGRKEVGGIVGHMEPNIVLVFEKDSLQILSEQFEVLGERISVLTDTIDTSNKKLTKELDALEADMDKIQDALDVISEELNLEELEKNKDKTDSEDSLEDEYENLKEMLDKLEDVDWDRVSKAITTISDSTADAYDKISNIQEIVSKTSKDAGEQAEVIMDDLEKIMDTLSVFEEHMGYTIEDISEEDTEEVTLGKVANCINYGRITGEINVGGIAGMMADETDLDAYEDIATSGTESLHAIYKMRVVVRDCKNFGTIEGSKQYIGGVAGQMLIGAVLESVNTGNLDALNADYVGGIAGESLGVIRNCSSKSIIAGDCYVGGIAGEGRKVQDCYAFVSIAAFQEKAGAILGHMAELPEYIEDTLEEEADDSQAQQISIENTDVIRNYYYLVGREVGGIDGIIYTGVTEPTDLEEFLSLPNLPVELKVVTICFKAQNQDEQKFTIAVGSDFPESEIPVLSVDSVEEYNWKIVPPVTSQVLGMGETETVEYISVESLQHILFNQTYEAIFDLKSTVIQATDKSENNLSVLLAEGVFARNTILTMTEELDMESFLKNWKVEFSNPGVTRLHYLIPSEVNKTFTKLYVKNTDGKWTEREFTVDGSYMIFDFTDDDVNFAILEDYSGLSRLMTWVGIGLVGIIVIIGALRFVLKSKGKK
ncbi:MAG: hypothetical protein E7283_00060 [Lachnospiraceae bacterium]|nr:hypothetical protein [Lachnospiraceae bacterium]